MRQKIRLSESQLRKLIKESVNKTLEEISDKTIVHAFERSDNFSKILEEIQGQFENLEDALGSLTSRGFSTNTPKNKEIEEIYYEFVRLSDRFKKLCMKKQSQFNNFEDEFQKRDYPEIEN